jgi:DNA-binding CsgD family transcriptional regulator
MTAQVVATNAHSRAEEAIAYARDLRELGGHLAQAARELLGASGTCFFPFAGSVSSSGDATFFQEELPEEHMRAQTLAFIPVQEREFSRGTVSALDRLFSAGQRVIDLNAMLEPEGLVRNPSFNEYWRPCRIERQLFAPLALGSQPAGYLATSRRVSEGAFKDTDRRQLEWLSERALRALHRLLTGGPQSAAQLLAALRGVPLACAVFNPAGTLLWISAAAIHALELRSVGTAFAELVEQNAGLAEWRAAALAALAQGHVSSAAGGLTLQRLSTATGPLMLVTRGRAAGAELQAPRELRQTWQLTARESEVLGELAAGRSNKDIALRLHCSVRTVDVHVSSLLRKARCGSRAELIARVLGAR